MQTHQLFRGHFIMLNLQQQMAEVISKRAPDKAGTRARSNLKNAGTDFSQPLIPPKELQQYPALVRSAQTR